MRILSELININQRHHGDLEQRRETTGEERVSAHSYRIKDSKEQAESVKLDDEHNTGWPIQSGVLNPNAAFHLSLLSLTVVIKVTECSHQAFCPRSLITRHATNISHPQ
jgi:hypothetical protein